MDILGYVSPAWVFSGFVVGLLIGLTGVGGGSLMTPLLILLFGTAPATAVGTDLLYATVTKSVGTFVHRRNGNVDWRIVGRLAAGSIPAAALTIIGMHTIASASRELSRLITLTLGIALMLSAASVLLRPLIRRSHDGPRRLDRWAAPLTVLAGFVLGVLVTLSSVGAGALGMVVLVLLYPRVRLVRLVGSDVAHAVPLTLAAGLGHVLLGYVDWLLLLSLLIGSLPGITIGSHFSASVPESVLRPVLAAILALVGVGTVFH